MKSVLRVVTVLIALGGWGFSNAYALDLLAGRAVGPPVIDGRIDFGEWPIATNSIDFDHGFVTAVNDRMRLYLLVDVLEDDIDNPRSSSSEGDWIEVVVDVDENGDFTPGVDLIYTLWNNSRELRIQYYLSDSGVRAPLRDTPIYSSLAAGFGCFADDATEVPLDPPSSSECFNHRVWEMAIDLEEIGADPNVFLPTEHVLLSVRVHSNVPAFEERFPEGGFADMLDIQLVTVPAVANTGGAGDSIRPRRHGRQTGTGSSTIPWRSPRPSSTVTTPCRWSPARIPRCEFTWRYGRTIPLKWSPYPYTGPETGETCPAPLFPPSSGRTRISNFHCGFSLTPSQRRPDMESGRDETIYFIRPTSLCPMKWTKPDNVFFLRQSAVCGSGNRVPIRGGVFRSPQDALLRDDPHQ